MFPFCLPEVQGTAGKACPSFFFPVAGSCLETLKQPVFHGLYERDILILMATLKVRIIRLQESNSKRLLVYQLKESLHIPK